MIRTNNLFNFGFDPNNYVVVFLSDIILTVSQCDLWYFNELHETWRNEYRAPDAREHAARRDTSPTFICDWRHNIIIRARGKLK